VAPATDASSNSITSASALITNPPTTSASFPDHQNMENNQRWVILPPNSYKELFVILFISSGAYLHVSLSFSSLAAYVVFSWAYLLPLGLLVLELGRDASPHAFLTSTAPTA